MNEEHINAEIRKNTRICHIINVLLIVLMIASIVLVVFFMVSCTTTKFVPIEKVKTVYENKTDTLTERELVHDSVLVYQDKRGDTIFIYKNRWHTNALIKWKTDTKYTLKYDSIPYPVIKEVEKKLNLWQQIKLHFGGLGIIGLLAIISIFIIRKRLK